MFSSVNTCWTLVGAFLVYFMQAGFALCEAGFTRAKNTGNILMKNMMDFCIGTPCYWLIGFGLMFGGTGALIGVVLFTMCYFTCQKLCSLAVASILLYTAPSFVVVLSAVLWKEPVTKKKLLALLLTLVGCALVCGVFSGGLTVTLTGILLGLGAGFFYALYSVFGRYALAHYDSMTVTVWTFLFAGPASLMLAPGSRTLGPALSRPDMWLTAAGLVVFSTVLPYIFYTKGLSRVEAGQASIMASLEPVVAALAGILAFGEPMSAATGAGILCVLAGVVILR